MILIIGQAPPIKEQTLPYDSTILYDWFKSANISKEDAQARFIFDAVYDKFPGHTKDGGHKAPTKAQFKDYLKRSLSKKINQASSIILLGNTACKFILNKELDWGTIHIDNNSFDKKAYLVLPHPSKRNTLIHQQYKEVIQQSLLTFLNYDIS